MVNGTSIYSNNCKLKKRIPETIVTTSAFKDSARFFVNITQCVQVKLMPEKIKIHVFRKGIFKTKVPLYPMVAKRHQSKQQVATVLTLKDKLPTQCSTRKSFRRPSTAVFRAGLNSNKQSFFCGGTLIFIKFFFRTQFNTGV